MSNGSLENMNTAEDLQYQEELAADGQLSGVEEESSEPYPFDVEKISISTKQISLRNIVRRLERGLIRAADIQRRDNLWDRGKQSRLIESLMLRIPLPLFYAAANKEDDLVIVDGLQRTGTFDRYINKKTFALCGLEFLRDYEGMKYPDLPDHMKIRIEETELNFVVINPESPPEVQRNVFKRLNTGGMPLTEQEIRHALYYGAATDLLKKLADSEGFKTATDNSVKDSRMAGQELVLRHLAFAMFGLGGYQKNEDMDAFLSDAMRAINGIENGTDVGKLSDSLNRHIINGDVKMLENKFLTAMKRARELFDIYAFRISTPLIARSNKIRTPINKSLFEVWSIYLSEVSDEDFVQLSANRTTLYKILAIELKGDESRRIIGRDSTKVASVKKRHELIRNITNEVIRSAQG